MYETKVNVGGMMCSMCETHIKEAIRKAYPAAKKLKASHVKNLASFESEEKPDEGAIKKAIEENSKNADKDATDISKRIERLEFLCKSRDCQK